MVSSRRSDQFALFDFSLLIFDPFISQFVWFIYGIHRKNGRKKCIKIKIQEMKNKFIVFGRVWNLFVLFSNVCARCRNSIRRKTYIYRTLFMASTMCASPRQHSDFRCRFFFSPLHFEIFIFPSLFVEFYFFIFLFYCLRQLPRQIEHNSPSFFPLRLVLLLCAGGWIRVNSIL